MQQNIEEIISFQTHIFPTFLNSLKKNYTFTPKQKDLLHKISSFVEHSLHSLVELFKEQPETNFNVAGVLFYDEIYFFLKQWISYEKKIDDKKKLKKFISLFLMIPIETLEFGYNKIQLHKSVILGFTEQQMEKMELSFKKQLTKLLSPLLKKVDKVFSSS